MHELSIAMQLVEVLEEELASEGDIRVLSVAVQVGVLTAVVPDALRMAWSVASADTLLHDAELEIVQVDATGYCAVCQAERSIADLHAFGCPECGSSFARIEGGRSLEVLHVSVEDIESQSA